MRSAATLPDILREARFLTVSGIVFPIVAICLILCCAGTVQKERGGAPPDRAETPVTGMPAAELIGKKRFVDIANPQANGEQSVSIGKRSRSEMILTGDQLEITLYEKLPVSQEKRMELKRVDEKGEIYLFPVGAVAVAGMTLSQARGLIERKMEGYIVTPLCEITLVKRDYEPHAFVFGEAVKPGSFPLHEGDRLLDVLSLAGGTTSKAYIGSIKLVRIGGDSVGVVSIDLGAILKKGHVENNLVMQDQDIVFIPTSMLSSVTELITKLAGVLPWYYFLKNF